MAGPDAGGGGPEHPGEPPPEPRPNRVTVPRGLALAAEWSWRLLAIGAAVFVVAYLASHLRLVVLPVFLALFFTALLRPVAERLRAVGAPPFAAALASVVLALATLAGLLALVVPRFVDEVEELANDLVSGVEDVADWLVEGPLGISRDQLEEWVDEVASGIQGSSDEIVSGLISGAQVAFEIAAGLGIALVLTFFFLKDGDRIWDWIVGLFSGEHRDDVRAIGSRSWATLAGYLRGMTVVALVDSVFIGLALVVLGVPGALALAVFTFFGAYIPIAGAVITGLLAVVVALISEGLVTGVLVLAAVLIVQQTESNLLHPFVVGRAVSVHPVAILLGVTAGAVLAGIIGAFVAVPIVAVASQVGGYLRERADVGEPVASRET